MSPVDAALFDLFLLAAEWRRRERARQACRERSVAMGYRSPAPRGWDHV